MAHLIFLPLIDLNHCAIEVVYACIYMLELAEPCCHGERFQHCTCTFVYGCQWCEIKRELVSPWSPYFVLEKRLGRYPKPCLIMVETCSITIVTSMKHSSYKKET